MRRTLCDNCQRKEVAQASLCWKLELEAQDLGAFYICECPETRCDHEEAEE